MFQVIAGHDPADPASAEEPVPDYAAMLGQGVKGLRIGLIRHFYTRDVAGDPEQVDALDAAVRLFAEAGAETTEITLRHCRISAPAARLSLAAEAYAVHERWLKERPQDYGARARERLLAGAGLRAVDISRRYAGAFSSVTRWQRRLRTSTRRLPPPAWIPPAASTTRLLPPITGRQARMPFNVTGQPGLVIPAGFSKNGLPLSLQLVGRPFSEAMPYRVAQSYEDATGWTKHHPAGLVD
jgi:aspartyl-tRNA(Asn)/glutamyl-tRNA(Gln) amidotransferase subunit A